MVYIAGDNITGPYGTTTQAAYSAMSAGMSAVTLVQDNSLAPVPVPLALIPAEVAGTIGQIRDATFLENLFVHSISRALEPCRVPVASADTVFIFASTKGNIGLLPADAKAAFPQSLMLSELARTVCRHFTNPNEPLVVSTACTSGVAALVVARRLLVAGRYKHAVVAGGDLVSGFVVSGFHCFQAISAERCKPFDRDRTGINLGEGSATMVLTTDSSCCTAKSLATIEGGATSNDANHISGPSRTGDGLFFAISQSMQEAAIVPGQLGYISAHGTATIYNDEMESKAFALAGVDAVLVNSLKAYIGHTLGAAGIMETILAVHQMHHSQVIASLGYEHEGTSVPLNVAGSNTHVNFDALLKTSSGFGGCNAALVVRKHK